jgi:phosphohistidine phosphatase
VRALLVRHAIAEDRAPSGRDEDRRLTDEGRRRMRAGARALAALGPELALVVSSPLVRARETAALLGAAFPARLEPDEALELAPDGDAAAVLERLAGWSGFAAVALVGHEPNLSRLEGFLLTGRDRSLAVFKKGGAALLELDARPAAGGAALLWHLTPAQLRGLGGETDA